MSYAIQAVLANATASAAHARAVSQAGGIGTVALLSGSRAIPRPGTHAPAGQTSDRFPPQACRSGHSPAAGSHAAGPVTGSDAVPDGAGHRAVAAALPGGRVAGADGQHVAQQGSV